MISRLILFFKKYDYIYILAVVKIFPLWIILLGHPVYAATSPPSVEARLQEWQALTASGATNFPAQRYADFLQQKPKWPLQDRILWRYQNALLREDNPTEIKQLCPTIPLSQLPAFLICSPFLTNTQKQARSLWISYITREEDEKLFLTKNPSILTPKDQWERYQNLEKKGLKTSAFRQINRLSLSDKPFARARFANQFNTSNADTLFLQSPHPYDKKLLLFRLKYLHHNNRYDEAVQLWLNDGVQNEQNLSAPEHIIWSTERIALARVLLRSSEENKPSQALQLLQPKSSTVLSTTDAQERILNGYIQLVLQNKPAKASLIFSPLTNAPSLYNQAAGLYWSARCADRLHQTQKALSLYQKASNIPTTFYGQLALAHIINIPILSSSERPSTFLKALQLRTSQIPHLKTGRIIRSDLKKAAQILYTQGDIKNATLFLTFLQAQTQSTAERQAVANFSNSLHISQPAIFTSRTLAQRGIAFFPEGYPKAPQIIHNIDYSLPKGLVESLIRQESSANPNAISPHQAIGLMQLLIGTARLTAQHHGINSKNITVEKLTDPQLNTQLGQLYLTELMQRFNRVIPYTLAAYNAGPGRVKAWNKDTLFPLPKENTNSIDDDYLLHWIMTIPYQETRLYVEHIETDMSLYALPRFR